MFQNKATSKKNFDSFIKKVNANHIVWGLVHPDGYWATCESNEFKDCTVYLFWSDKAYAKRHCIEEWKEYEPIQINLDSFIDLWLKGMHQDGCLLGPNWNANLYGMEVEALKVAHALGGS